jgi:predicted HTH domain antitoxin
VYVVASNSMEMKAGPSLLFSVRSYLKGVTSMETPKMERIEIDLPQDIILAMRGLEKPEKVRRKLKIALAILLFQERAISLGKATELAAMSRVRFMEMLKEHDIPAYEYGEKDFERDRQVIAKYRNTVAG